MGGADGSIGASGHCHLSPHCTKGLNHRGRCSRPAKSSETASTPSTIQTRKRKKRRVSRNSSDDGESEDEYVPTGANESRKRSRGRTNEPKPACAICFRSHDQTSMATCETCGVKTHVKCTQTTSNPIYHVPVEDETWYCVSCMLMQETAMCMICNKGGDDDALLLCDQCNSGCHMYCLSPPLKSIPEDDWFCPDCSAPTLADEEPILLRLSTKTNNRGHEDDLDARGVGQKDKRMIKFLHKEIMKGPAPSVVRKRKREFLKCQDPRSAPLPLPPSSFDLALSNDHIMLALEIYEVLRHFYQQLALSQFTFEDFARSILEAEPSPLLSHVHVALMSALLEGYSAIYTFDEELQYALLDRYTWPALIGNLVDQIIRSYGNLEIDQTVLSAAKCLEKIPYERLMVSEKLDILKFLVDMFLPIPVIRKGLDNPGHAPEEDFCRVCQQDGELLLCETCPAAYHIYCLRPPLMRIPDDDWYCPDCSSAVVSGVTDCRSPQERDGVNRGHILGVDRVQRTYTWAVRRVFVESTDRKMVYYSTKEQLDILLQVLDSRLEAELINEIEQHYEEITRQMAWTVEATKSVIALQSLTVALKPFEYNQLDAPNDATTIRGYKIEPLDAFELWNRRGLAYEVPPLTPLPVEEIVEEKVEETVDDDDDEAEKEIRANATVEEDTSDASSVESDEDTSESANSLKVKINQEKGKDSTAADTLLIKQESDKETDMSKTTAETPNGSSTEKAQESDVKSEHMNDTEGNPEIKKGAPDESSSTNVSIKPKDEEDQKNEKVEEDSSDSLETKGTSVNPESEDSKASSGEPETAEELDPNPTAVETPSQKNATYNVNVEKDDDKDAKFSITIKETLPHRGSGAPLPLVFKDKPEEKFNVENTRLFRLGDEMNFRRFTNRSTATQVYVPKTVSSKFHGGSLKNFRWKETPNYPVGNIVRLYSPMATLQASIIEFDTSIPNCFQYIGWSTSKNLWRNDLKMANSVKEIAAALITLEESIKFYFKCEAFRIGVTTVPCGPIDSASADLSDPNLKPQSKRKKNFIIKQIDPDTGIPLPQHKSRKRLNENVDHRPHAFGVSTGWTWTQWRPFRSIKSIPSVQIALADAPCYRPSCDMPEISCVLPNKCYSPSCQKTLQPIISKAKRMNALQDRLLTAAIQQAAKYGSASMPSVQASLANKELFTAPTKASFTSITMISGTKMTPLRVPSSAANSAADSADFAMASNTSPFVAPSYRNPNITTASISKPLNNSAYSAYGTPSRAGQPYSAGIPQFRDDPLYNPEIKSAMLSTGKSSRARCGICGVFGHYAPTCPLNPGGMKTPKTQPSASESSYLRRSKREPKTKVVYNIEAFGESTIVSTEDKMVMEYIPCGKFISKRALRTLGNSFNAQSQPSPLIRTLGRKAGAMKIPGVIYKTSGGHTMRMAWRWKTAQAKTVAELMLRLRELDVALLWDQCKTPSTKQLQDTNYEILAHKVSGWRTEYHVQSSGYQEDGTEGSVRKWIRESELTDLFWLVKDYKNRIDSMSRFEESRRIENEKRRIKAQELQALAQTSKDRYAYKYPPVQNKAASQTKTTPAKAWALDTYQHPSTSQGQPYSNQQSQSQAHPTSMANMNKDGKIRKQCKALLRNMITRIVQSERKEQEKANRRLKQQEGRNQQLQGPNDKVRKETVKQRSMRLEREHQQRVAASLKKLTNARLFVEEKAKTAIAKRSAKDRVLMSVSENSRARSNELLSSRHEMLSTVMSDLSRADQSRYNSLREQELKASNRNSKKTKGARTKRVVDGKTTYSNGTQPRGKVLNRKNKQSQQEVKEPEPDPEPELFCICQKPQDDEEYVACEACEGWFHYGCCNAKPEDYDEQQPFVCPNCISSHYVCVEDDTATAVATKLLEKQGKATKEAINIFAAEMTQINKLRYGGLQKWVKVKAGTIFIIPGRDATSENQFRKKYDPNFQAPKQKKTTAMPKNKDSKTGKDRESSTKATIVVKLPSIGKLAKKASADALFGEQSKSAGKRMGFGDDSMQSKKRKISESRRDKANVDHLLMGVMIRSIQADPDAEPFMEPVTEDIAPGYFDVVKRPIDFGTIAKKCDSGEYQTINDFVTDVEQVKANCFLYNDPSSEICSIISDIIKSFQSVRTILTSPIMTRPWPSNAPVKVWLVQLLTELSQHKLAIPFSAPVPRDTPDYFNIVRRPMDLSTVLKKLSTEKYDNLCEVVADVSQVWVNCRIYNGDAHELVRYTKLLEKLFLGKFCSKLGAVSKIV